MSRASRATPSLRRGSPRLPAGSSAFRTTRHARPSLDRYSLWSSRLLSLGSGHYGLAPRPGGGRATLPHDRFPHRPDPRRLAPTRPRLLRCPHHDPDGGGTMSDSLNRRDFVVTSALAGAGLAFPARLRGHPPAVHTRRARPVVIASANG